MKYEAVIGLEIHVQLKTKSKMFCSCKNKYGSETNTAVCPVCLGYPGALPVLNKTSLNKAIMVGLSLNCNINNECKFDRKNYFYPDLPKGYQISQYDQPIAYDGFINIDINNNEKKKIRIIRAHLEEDTGKSIHGQINDKLISYLDFNRCGIPLMEIVTKPDINNSEEAILFLNKLRRILRYINASDCNMEEGTLRCDVNISVKKLSDSNYGTKVEIKNLNSFKNIKNAIEYETSRHIQLLEENKVLIQETRSWDTNTSTTKTMRIKEDENDYRYFSEPDLVPLSLTNEYIESMRKKLPELQEDKIQRFRDTYKLPEYDLEILTEYRELADYYEEAVSTYPDGAKKISNWIMTEVLGALKDKKVNITDFNIDPKNLGQLIELIDNGTITRKIGKEIFQLMIDEGGNPKDIIKNQGLKQISNENELEPAITRTIEENPLEVEKFKNGKTNVLSFFIGEIMKETNGQANPDIVKKLLREKLES